MTTIDLTDPDLKLEAAPIRSYKPLPEEEKLIRDGLAYVVIKAPMFAHLFYNETRLVYSLDIPMAATDGRTIFVNPRAMIAAKWTLKNVAFVLLHEIGHVIFNDLVLAMRFRADGYVITPDGQLPYDHELMNIAEDLRINAMLKEARLGEMPDGALYDPGYSMAGMESSIEIYAKLYKQIKKRGKRPGNGKIPINGGTNLPGHGSFDIHLAPQKKEAANSDAKHTQAIAAAVESARASGQGTIPACVMKLLGELLDPKVSWQDHLRSTMMRNGGDPTYDWRYLDKRLLARSEPMYFARQAHMGAGVVVLAGDDSGSVFDKSTEFFSEMSGICADLNPLEVIVIWCDAAVNRVDHVDEPEDLIALREEVNADGGTGGGGGTDFRPVFRWIEENGIEPDMLVYFTDTYGTFPQNEPHYPVIWASIVEKPTVPFGEVVFVEA